MIRLLIGSWIQECWVLTLHELEQMFPMLLKKYHSCQLGADIVLFLLHQRFLQEIRILLESIGRQNAALLWFGGSVKELVSLSSD